jgi:Zn-dependent peptidase ImmA (M78 family)/transcriptional regulator with XRE-family HTH domain
VIGQRLKVARLAAGLSLRDLSDKIGNLVTPQAIGKYERNEDMPGSKPLLALSAALAVSPEYLLGDQTLVLEGMEFRRQGDLGRRAESHLEARVLDRLERYLTVEEMLALPSLSWDQPREAPYPVSTIADADHAAQRLRMAWGLGRDPIPNLVELLEERGIKIHVESLDADIDGLLARVRRADGPPIPVIIVNGTHWGERQRFTLAHELAHLVLDVSNPKDGEKAAHRFAGAFLMPAETIWAEIGKHRTSISVAELLALKGLFGASLQAITYRLRDLNVLPEPLFKDLFDLFKERGWRTPPYEEPAAIQGGEKPQRFSRLCYRALSEGVISEAKTAELLGISVHTLSQQLDNSDKVTT